MLIVAGHSLLPWMVQALVRAAKRLKGSTRAASTTNNNLLPASESAQEWFYANGEVSAGPVTIAAIRELLRQGSLSTDNLVWNETFGQTWKSIRDTEIVKDRMRPSQRIPDPRSARTSQANGNGLQIRYKSRMKLSPLLILLALVIGAWAYLDFPSLNTLLEWPVAKDECVKFAEKNKGGLFFESDGEIRAFDSWWKHGKIVVEVGALKANEDTFVPRLCVVGNGTIQIVSILENGTWR